MVTYKQCGVNISLANLLVEKLKKTSPEIGGFSGLFSLEKFSFRQPVLAGSADGVGTKLRIAQILNKHNTIGIDLVGMVVNDIITTGATPLFLFDYFATGKLRADIFTDVIKGIQKGCKEANCLLLGGETAEMPLFYKDKEYDLAGFGVGIVEKSKIIDGSKTKDKDLIIGLPSNGIHSNGYSLINRLFSKKEIKEKGEVFLKPTKIYVKEILELLQKGVEIKGIAHITGGGIKDNLIRVLPTNCKAIIDTKSWKIPEIFKIIQKKGKISDNEMFKIFNMGIGMILIISPNEVKKINQGKIIGEIITGKKEVKLEW